MNFLSEFRRERERNQSDEVFFVCLIRWRYHKLNYFQKFWYFFSKNVSYTSIKFLYNFEFFFFFFLKMIFVKLF